MGRKIFWGACTGIIVSFVFCAFMEDTLRRHGVWMVIPFICFGGLLFGASLPIVRNFLAEKRSLQLQCEAASRSLLAQRERLRNDLVMLNTHSKTASADLPHLLRTAIAALDTAEDEFKEGVIPSFWDAVEQAVNSLASFESKLQVLISNSNEYRAKSQNLGTPAVEPFQISFRTLPDPTPTAKRLRALVRQAQKSFQFVTIYEQRKTNQLLVAGFSSLGQAIGEMGDRLDFSLGELSSSLDHGAAGIREQMRSDAESRQEHEEKTREMLDNIQHRRKPR